jgi:DNA-binding CsgD family transcriptional regulator
VLLARIAGAFFALETTAGCALGEEALEIATRLGDPLMIGSTAAALAHAHANAGHVSGTRAALALAAPQLDAADDRALAPHLDAVNRLAWSENLIEADDDAIRHANRGIGVARATGQDQFVPMLAGALALSLVRKGELGAATAACDEALETAELAANDYVTSWALTTSAHVAAAAGDLERSRRDAERATALADGRAGRIEAMALARLAVTRRAQGERPDGVEARISALAPSWTVGLAEAMTRIELADGRSDEAERFAALTAAAARRLELPIASALAARARASLLLAGGDAAAAAELAAKACSSAPLEDARSQALAGRALAQVGERADAVRELRAAERAFDTCGAERERDQARRELRKLGARSEPRGPAARGVSGLESLSRREREIADLVRDRMTNREIAAELFLSEKTIETHLRNVFAKLGAASRVDVARAIERA